MSVILPSPVVWINEYPPGRCRVCGGELPGHRTRNCSDECARAYERWFYERRFWIGIRRRLLRDAKYRCSDCGVKFQAGRRSGLEIHHIIPRRKGGHDGDENLMVLCRLCHDKPEYHTEPPQARQMRMEE